MDPPLIDVFVNGGYRKGDRNLPEAQAIVDEIAAIIREPSNTARTIGVVTLLGIEQSKLITELIYKQIAPESVQKHKLVVGAPPMFQGRERDVMLVSMVLQQGDKTAANSLGQQQRFNVALSRARERTYLFRSVADGSFGADTLSGRLMQHFKSPFRHDPRVVEKLRDLCESGFEASMFDELVKRGYKVQPQVPCGGYRIDFVVEGQNGRRLAVECDGDRFHGPNQWSADMARQRVLERAGWVFWRCFASSFVRRTSDVMLDLVSTLDGLGIEPIEHGEQTQPAWTERREVGPLSGNPVQPEPPVSSAAVQPGEPVQSGQSGKLEPIALTFSS
jgi:very-short-patch-repair endonuclease